MTAPVLPPAEGPAAAAVSGEPLAPPAAGPYTPPQGGLDLALRIWTTLTWARIGQVAALLFVVAVIAAGLGVVLHALGGTAGLWTALGGTGVAAGAGVPAVRRRAAARRDRRAGRRR